MSTRFDKALERVFSVEGGYVNDPKDPGGATNYGISLRFLVVEGHIDLDHDGFADFDLDRDGDIDGADIRKLTKADAAELYRRCFWDRLHCDDITIPLDIALFDQAVNCGIKPAVKCLQKAINLAAGAAMIEVDGAFGPKSRDVLTKLSAAGKTAKVLTGYRAFVEGYYLRLIAEKPALGRFKNGWVARARSLGNV